MSNSLRITKLDSRAVIPKRAYEGDAALDLCALDDCLLEPGKRDVVRTGLALEIPTGFAGLVLPRSGLARKHGITLTNSPGLIDSGYRGEIQVLLVNTDRNDPFEISAGDRIAQLMIVPFSAPEIELVDELVTSERGNQGFGSSGVSS